MIIYADIYSDSDSDSDSFSMSCTIGDFDV